MPYRVVVINPNSTQAVTDAISLSVDVHRQGDCQVDCLTLPEGPPGIVTQTHKAAIVAPMQAVIAREQDDADAFVIACYGEDRKSTRLNSSHVKISYAVFCLKKKKKKKNSINVQM